MTTDKRTTLLVHDTGLRSNTTLRDGAMVGWGGDPYMAVRTDNFSRAHGFRPMRLSRSKPAKHNTHEGTLTRTPCAKTDIE